MWRLNAPIFFITVILSLMGIMLLETRASKLTRSIRRLYETLVVVIEKMEDDKTLVRPNVLSYREHNHEINELHKTFNSVVKTMITANKKEYSTETALLNYSDAYYIEQYAQDQGHRSICISNIGELMF